MSISPFPHLAFNEKGELESVGIDLDPLGPELTVAEIPEKIGTLHIWSGMHCARILIERVSTQLANLADAASEAINEAETEEDKDAYVRASFRYRDTRLVLQSAYRILKNLTDNHHYDADTLREYGEAVTRENPDAFTLLPLLYKIFDKIEDLNIGASQYFRKQDDVNDESISTIIKCSQDAAFCGAIRVLIKDAISIIDDGSIDMSIS